MSITQCISLVLIEVNLEGLLLDASYSPTTDPKTLPHIMKQTTKQTNHNISLKKCSGSLGVVVVVGIPVRKMDFRCSISVGASRNARRA